MKNKNVFLNLILLICFGLFISCGERRNDVTDKKETKTDSTKSNSKVVTKEEQSALTPDKVLTLLKTGNENYVKGQLTEQNILKQINEAAKGQYPKAVILSCIDSRVPVEKVFDQSIGDIFVARVAGNIVNPDILGSMEDGCGEAGGNIFVVLGHSECGAVKAAIDDVKLGNITELLSKLRPAINSLNSEKGDKTSKNK